MESDGYFGADVVTLSAEVGVLDLHELEDDIAGRALHPLVAHVGVAQVGVAGRAGLDLERELLHSGDDLLGVAEMALPADDLALALASRTDLRVHVVVSSAELNPSRHSSLPRALVARDHVVGILSASALAVRAGHLLLHQHVQLLPQVEILELQKDLDLQLRPLELVEVKLMVDVGIIHLLDPNAVVEVLLVLVVERLVG